MGKLKDITDYLLGIGITDDEDAPEAGTPAMLASETPENKPDAAEGENDSPVEGDPVEVAPGEGEPDGDTAGDEGDEGDGELIGDSGSAPADTELDAMRDQLTALATENETLRQIIAEMGGIVPGAEDHGNIAPADADRPGDEPSGEYDEAADIAEQEAELERIKNMR